MRRDLQYMIDVMTAARDGKKIQCKAQYKQDQWEPLPVGSGGWCWNWPSFDYRIAPEPRKPREWRIPVLRDQPFLYQQPMPPEGEFVTVREVLPE